MEEAYEAYNKISDYKDCRKRAFASLFQIQTKQFEFATIYPGQTILWGQFEQNNDISDGMEPIEWVILDSNGEYIRLISKEILDNQPYSTEGSENKWETSSLRKWLNETFYTSAFGPDFQKMITADPVTGDYVSILSAENNLYEKDSAWNFFDTYADTECVATEYARAGLSPNSRGYCDWWLRPSQQNTDKGEIIWKDGYILDNTNPSYLSVVANAGVRPVIWIKLDYAPIYSSPWIEEPASEAPDIVPSPYVDKAWHRYLRAAITDSPLIVEGSVQFVRKALLPSDSGGRDIPCRDYTFSVLSILYGSYEKEEICVLVPGNASVYDFDMGKRYILFLNTEDQYTNPSDPTADNLYQAYRIRCRLFDDQISHLIVGGYNTDYFHDNSRRRRLMTRNDMLDFIHEIKGWMEPEQNPQEPEQNPQEPEPPQQEQDPDMVEVLAPAPEGTAPFVSINADNVVSYLKAALTDSSMVAEGIIGSKRSYQPHTYPDQNNPVQWNIYTFKIHHVFAGHRVDDLYPLQDQIDLLVPGDNPALDYEVGGRYIVVVNSPDSVFYPSDTLILYQGYQIRCKLSVGDSNVIHHLQIGDFAADYPKTKQEFEALIEETVGLGDRYYNPKDYYIHEDWSIESVVRRAPLIARVTVRNIIGEQNPETWICLCTIRVPADVWEGDIPAVPDQEFKIRVPRGSVAVGQTYVVCIQRHVDQIDREGNPLCLQPYSIVDILGKPAIIYDTVYEPAAKNYWVFHINDKWAVDKIQAALKARRQ
ncbi:MAG: hypothetical protein II781_01585 [Clostridia bacterium]|nr:hypothetical protein [Clostridia bacterium]